MRALKIALGAAAAYLVLKLRIYAGWSLLYRALFERRYRGVEISTYRSYEELIRATSTLTWTADTWRQLWDAISLPERVESVLRQGGGPVGDCDEFAIYNVAALNKSLASGEFTGDPELRAASLMTVTWLTADGRYGGHNVTLLHREHDYWYMDYFAPTAIGATPRQIALAVVEEYATGGTLLLYGVSSEDLLHVRTGR